MTISKAALEIEEGSSDTYTVVLDTEPAGEVTVTIGGVADTDVSLDKTVLTFSDQDWDTAQTVTVTAGQDDDAVDEAEVIITHTVSSTDDSTYQGVTADSVAVTITDDDSVGVTVSKAALEIEEGASDTYTVVLDTEPAGDVTVTIGGVADTDVSLDKTILTFSDQDWDTPQTVTVTAEHDDDAVDEAVVTITHTVSSTDDTDYDGLTAAGVAVTITDDAPETVTVSFEQGSYTVAEGSSVTVKVTLSEDPERTVTIPLTKAGQGGATSADYSSVPANVVFNASDTEKSITFTATADDDNDDGESVKLAFGSPLPAGVTEGSTKEAVVSITDDDVPAVTVSFEQGSYTVAEGNTVTVKVTLSEDPERTVTIPLTKAGQGGATSADYSGVPANVVFNASDTEKSITFTATADDDNDDGESVKLAFGSPLPAGVTEGSTKEAVVSITDDDVPAVTVSFEQGSYTVAEGSSVTVKVQLDADPERTVTIPLTEEGQDGASGADYSGVPASVVFNRGETEKEITFSAASDSDNDDGESVKLAFGSPLPAGVTEGSTKEAVVSITDDDVPAVTVSFEQGSYTVAEGSSVTVKVTLSEDPERTVTILLTKANQGGATSADYSGVPANVVFNASDTEKSITFTATADDDNDDGESVKLAFGSPLPAGVTEGSTKEAVVSITDDDVPAVTVSFEQGSYTVAEGNTVTVKVTLSEDPERTVTIPLTKAGQGGATSADYSGVPANVVFNASDTEKSFTFTATADDDNDDGESVKLAFGSPLPAGVTEGSTKEAVVSITDDDVPAVTVSFEQGSYTVAEGNTVTVKVTLSEDPERTVTILLTKANQDGASSADYSGVPANVVFNASDTEKSITFTATADDDNDDGESVKLAFGSPLPAGVSAGTTNETTISITDDDLPSVTVSFAQGSYTVAEGSTVTVKVQLDADPERTVTIPLTEEGQDGASASDYSGVPANVVFNASDTEKTFEFSAASDSENDDGESVKLGFDTLPTGVSAGTTNETTVSITDDDLPSVSVSFAQGSYTVAEGSTVTVKVQLDADPERTVTIPLTEEGQDGASNADYSGVPASVVFNRGETEKEITFSAADDTIDDDGESVKLGFGNSLPTGVSAGNTNETTISITDDDLPSVSVSFAQGSYTVAEGSTVTVKVQLDADPERTVTIPLTEEGQDGASGADYSGVPANVVFNASDTEKSFTFTATADDDNDDGESVKLGFGNSLPAGVSAGTTNETTISITDDDLPSVTVSFAQGSYTVAEGSTVTVKVQLDADPERTVTIPLTEEGQDGASASDYSGVPANVVFNASDTEKTFEFSAASDSENDDGESVKLGFDTLPAGVSEGSTGETTISITDDDLPSVTVSFEQGSYTVAEGNTVTVKVTLSEDPERTVTILLTKANQDGASSADYSGVPANVVFNASDTEKSITFTATADDDNDDGESVKLGFDTLPTGVSAGTTSETTVSINDDDDASLVLSTTTLPIGEAGSGAFTVKLGSKPTATVTVSISSGDTGAATVSHSSLSFSASNWNTAQTVTVSGVNDDDTSNETLNVSLSASDGGYTGETAEVSVTVSDNDTANLVVTPTSLTVAEASEGDFTVKLATQPSASVTVSVSSDDTGAATLSTASLAFTATNWNTAQTVTVSGVNDADTSDETVTVSLAAQDGGYAGKMATVLVSVTDDDDVAGVSVDPTAVTMNEGESAEYTVVLDSEPSAAVTVTVGGTAGTGVSTDKTSLSFTTANWSEKQTVTVSAAQDPDAVDESVTITHTVSSTDGEYNGANADSVAVEINDDETVTRSLGLAMPDPIHGDTDTDGEVNLGDTLTYTATAANTGNVALDEVTVADLLVNTSGEECASLNIGATCVLTGTHTITQADVDAGKVVNTATASATGATAQTVTNEFTVDQVKTLSLVKDTNATGYDQVGDVIPYTYAVTNSGTVTLDGTLEIQDNKIPSGITCPAVPGSGMAPDQILTCTGSYTVVQSDVDAGEVTNKATAALDGITSNEDSVEVAWRAPQGTGPRISIVSGQVEEDDADGNISLSVTLSPSSLQTVTVDYATSDGTASAGSDYTAASGTLTFSPGQTDKTITLTITDDDVDEADETITVTLTNPSNATLQAGADEGTGTIRDDDTAGVTLSTTSLDITEGGNGTYTVVLDSEPTGNVTVTLASTTGAGVSVDKSAVTFTASNWDTAQTVTLEAEEDDDTQDSTATVAHTATSSGDAKYDGIAVDSVVVSVTDNDTQALVLSSTSLSVDEGDSDGETYTVKLATEPDGDVTVTIAGQAGTDLSLDKTSLTFTTVNWDTEQDVTAVAADDSDADDESVTLTHTASGGGYGSVTKSLDVTILDDAPDSLTVSFNAASYSVDEGSSVTVKVTLSTDPERTVTIPLTKANQGGASNADYSGVPANVVFNSGDTEKEITFSATPDDVDDDGESVKLGFDTLPAGVSAGSANEAVVSITDDDVPAVQVSYDQGSYTVAEGSSVTVKVTLSSDPERTVTIPLTKADQDGASNSDYSGVPADLTFNPGDTEKTFDFSAASDSDNDDGESVKLGFGNTLPAGVSAGSTNEAVVSITDDDVPAVQVSFEQGSYTVAEGSSVTVKVKLDADPERTVTIPLTKANQDGASSADYSGVPANVVFNSSDTEKEITFNATADSDNDDGESVKLGFGNTLPADVSTGSTDEAVVSITDDDVPSVTVSYEQGSYTVTEGSSVTVKVKLDADPERTVTISISRADQDGASNSDYSGVPADLTFNPGDTEKTFDFSAAADSDNDDGESVKLGFDSLPTGVSAGSTNEATVSITDDDVPAVTVSYEQGSYTVAEGSSVTVKVTLSADPERTVTIPLTKADQDGASSADYSGVPADLTFNPGDTEKSITFSAAADSDNDDGESLKLGFDTLPAGVSAGSTNETTVSITDDDVPSVTANFGAASYSVTEGQSVTVKVTLSADPERSVTILITKTNQNGASGSDYTGVPESVVFNPGDTEKTFSVSAVDDTEDDDGESILLALSTLPSGVSGGAAKETTVAITDNDETTQTQVSVQVSFKVSGYTLTEGGTTSIAVKLSADPERSVTIPVTATDGTEATSDDYSGVPASVDFAIGDTEKSFTFTAAQDAIDENLEEVTLGFGTLPSGVSTASPAQTVVAIRDSLHVSFDKSYYEAYEGGAGAEVTVKLDGPAVAETVIPIIAAAMDGATGADWTGVPAQLTFDAGDTEKSFTVMAYDDTVEDDGESVELSFNTLPPGVARGNHAIATVELMNMETTRAQAECPEDSGMRVVLNSVEEITQEGQSQFLRVKLDPARAYLIEVYGSDSPLDIVGDDTQSENLTLEDPRVLAVWNDDRTQKLQGHGSGNKEDVLRASVPSGWHQLEISGNGSAGTYRIIVRVNNICISSNGFAHYPWFGGPDGYVFDAPAYIYSSETTHQTSRNPLIHPDKGVGSGFLGDNWDWYWDDIPDVDWHEWNVDQSEKGQTYEIGVWASEKYPVIHQATNLEIKGIYDAQGDLLDGTSGSGTGSRVIVTFEPSVAGKYYIAVGSGATDRTGMYEIKIVKHGQGNERHSKNSEPEDDGQKQGKSDGEQPNRPASGKLRISGEARVGRTLTADTSGVQDQDGLEKVSFSYQWLGDDAEIAGATGSTYTLADADAGKAIKVRVTFTDDDGNDEALTSAATNAVEPEHTNTPAVGQPVIGGEAQVGQTLTADTSGIQDQDGLENAAFSYQWLGDDAEIAGATGSTYTLADADAGKGIKVRVTFTDDEGNDEALTSAATNAVATASPAEPPPKPTNLTAVVNDDGSVTLNWDAPDDDSVTGYQILRRRPSEGENDLLVHVEDTGSTATTYIDTEVTAGIRHIYRVKAINEAGLSQRSNHVRVEP